MSPRSQYAIQKLPLTARVLAAALICAVIWALVRGRREPLLVLDLHATPSFWSENGYVEMVPPLRLPGRAARELEASVWLRLPPGTRLSLRTVGSPPRASLDFPEGTDAVRVEVWHGTKPNGELLSVVTAARGEHFEPRGGRRVFVLAPRSATDPAALRGYSWPSSDRAAEARASELVAHLGAGMPAPHSENASEPTQTILNVLSDHAPLESPAPRELNLEDAAIAVRCGDAPAERAPGSAGVVVRCADGTLPVGYLDVPRALAAGDTRVQALCRSRRYLYEHLEASGRSAFSAAFRACSITN